MSKWNLIRTSIQKVANSQDLSKFEAEWVMKNIMSGSATPSQIGAFLTALRIKGETIQEIASFARIMRQFTKKVKPKVDDILVDTCGTGGDKIKTFNISTGAMFIAAGAGIKVAKHGNRSVTSKCGSADVLEALGVNIKLSPEKVKQTIENVGIGFMFAPIFHDAMKYATQPRREIGLRTVFNVLGPLTNPAGAQAQVMGVYDSSLTEKLAYVLSELECKQAMVVHGLDGLDEISTLGKTQISELKNGAVETYTIEPTDYGISRATPEKLAGMDAEENSKILLKVLKGKRGFHRDITQLNAAAAILVSRKAENLKQGLEMADEAIDSGKALSKLKQLVEATEGKPEKLKILEDSL